MAAYLPDTPPAAGRAWVPGCRARTFRRSVNPFYDETLPGGSPRRDRFVISIGNARLMYLITGLGEPCPGTHVQHGSVNQVPCAFRRYMAADREPSGAGCQLDL